MIRVASLSDATGCDVLIKCEFANPGGSVKDRVALKIMREAMADGTLRRGGVVAEGTAGSTGVSVAMVANALGCEAFLSLPDDAATEKTQLMRAFGAEVQPVRPVAITHEDHFAERRARRARAAARPRRRKKAKRKETGGGGLFCDQFENLANARAHFEGTDRRSGSRSGRWRRRVVRRASRRTPRVGNERRTPRDGGFLSSARRTEEREKKKIPGRVRVRVRHGGDAGGRRVVSATRGRADRVLPGGPAGLFPVQQGDARRAVHAPGGGGKEAAEPVRHDHRGRRDQPAHAQRRRAGDEKLFASEANERGRTSLISPVAFRCSDREAVEMSRFLARNDGLFLGSSSCVNVVGAVKAARRLGPGKRVVTIACDGGGGTCPSSGARSTSRNTA